MKKSTLDYGEKTQVLLNLSQANNQRGGLDMDDFLLKVVIVTIAIQAFYWWNSPYETCVRKYGDSAMFECGQKMKW